MRILCVRECNYRLESSTSPPKQNKHTQKPQTQMHQTPSHPTTLRIKSKCFSPPYTGQSGPCQPLYITPQQASSPVLSCLKFPSCLRLFSSSQFCVHHALCLECPSLNLGLANTFLSFGDCSSRLQETCLLIAHTDACPPAPTEL